MEIARAVPLRFMKVQSELIWHTRCIRYETPQPALTYIARWNSIVQILGIESHELNRFRFSSLFFENSRMNPHSIEPNQNWTELRVGQLWTELNWTLHTIEIAGGQTELSAEEFLWSYISESSIALELNLLWPHLNKSIQKGCHWCRIVNWTVSIGELNYLKWISGREFWTELNWIYNSERESELNPKIRESARVWHFSYLI